MGISSRALLTPGGAVDGFDDLAAALAGAANRFQERKDRDKQRATDHTQSVKDRAASVGVDPSNMTDDQITAAIAGRVQKLHDEKTQGDADHWQSELQYRADTHREDTEARDRDRVIAGQDRQDAREARQNAQLESSLRGDQTRRDLADARHSEGEDRQYMQALQLLNSPNLDPATEQRAHQIINMHDGAPTARNTFDAPGAHQLDDALAGRGEMPGQASMSAGHIAPAAQAPVGRSPAQGGPERSPQEKAAAVEDTWRRQAAASGIPLRDFAEQQLRALREGGRSDLADLYAQQLGLAAPGPGHYGDARPPTVP